LNRRPDEEPPDEETKARFATAIGSLMYLMVGTRCNAMALRGFDIAKQSLQGDLVVRLWLRRVATQRADFGGSVVTDGAYSTSGYVFQLAGAPVSWSSKRQVVSHDVGDRGSIHFRFC
jgi:hypothetical protein